jgi:uncharacterized protein YeaO (DUF488 family)
MSIHIKRAYDAPTRSDGYRVRVDRVWPRGVSREALQPDARATVAASSIGLRKWFGHCRAKWREFKARYFRELQENATAFDPVPSVARRRTATLVYGAKDTQFNNAIALKEFIGRRATRERGGKPGQPPETGGIRHAASAKERR